MKGYWGHLAVDGDAGPERAAAARTAPQHTVGPRMAPEHTVGPQMTLECLAATRMAPEHEVGARMAPEHSATRRMVPELAAALAAELVRRADEERCLMRRARVDPVSRCRRALTECREANAEALGTIVHRHGWPTADLVGVPASTAALMILLHAADLDFQLTCRDLIAQAAADGRCPALHHAYIADHCAVEQGRPQFYGTRVNPVTLRPYPIRRPETLDERRRDVGLGPLDEQMRTLRDGG